MRPSRSTAILLILIGLGLGMALQAERTRRQIQREAEDLLSAGPRRFEPDIMPGGLVLEDPEVMFQDAQGRALPGWLDTEPEGSFRVADVRYRDHAPDGRGPVIKTALRIPHHQLGMRAPYWYEATGDTHQLAGHPADL